MEFKSIPFEVKEFSAEDGTFYGVASFFGNEDLVGDIVLKGAFKKTLQERGDRIFIAWMHDWATPIGKPLHVKETKDGLEVKAKISLTRAGQDALILLRDGVVKELSIGFDVIKQEWAMADKDGHVVTDRNKGLPDNHPVRLLKELRLYEISVVTVAANERAAITEVKEKITLENPFLDDEFKGIWQNNQLDNSEIFYNIEEKAAIPYKKTKLAPEDTPWDAGAEMKKADSPEAWRAMCAMVVGDADAKGSYKLPHHKGDEGHACVWNGVKAAMGALGGARRPVQGEGQSGARAHIAKHYADFDKPLPGESDGGDDEGKSVEPAGQLLQQRLALRVKLLKLESGLQEENSNETE